MRRGILDTYSPRVAIMTFAMSVNFIKQVLSIDGPE